MKEKNKKNDHMVSFGTWLLLGILTIVVIIFSVKPQFAPIISDLTLEKVLVALGGIFIIVLLVERVTEIVVAIWWQAKTDQLEAELSALKGDLTKAADETAKKAKEEAKELVKEKDKELVKYKAETKGFSLLFSFALSIVVCSAGVGLLGAIIEITEDAKFLRGVDIVLTSGLIAGGSDEYHQFVRALERTFKKIPKS